MNGVVARKTPARYVAVRDMDPRNLLRGGTPVVCLAFRRAFKQEADYLSRIQPAGSSRGAVPRISIEIVPDTAVEPPERAPAARAKEEPGG